MGMQLEGMRPGGTPRAHQPSAFRLDCSGCHTCCPPGSATQQSRPSSPCRQDAKQVALQHQACSRQAGRSRVTSTMQGGFHNTLPASLPFLVPPPSTPRPASRGLLRKARRWGSSCRGTRPCPPCCSTALSACGTRGCRGTLRGQGHQHTCQRPKAAQARQGTAVHVCVYWIVGWKNRMNKTFRFLVRTPAGRHRRCLRWKQQVPQGRVCVGGRVCVQTNLCCRPGRW